MGSSGKIRPCGIISHWIYCSGPIEPRILLDSIISLHIVELFDIVGSSDTLVSLNLVEVPSNLICPWDPLAPHHEVHGLGIQRPNGISRLQCHWIWWLHDMEWLYVILRFHENPLTWPQWLHWTMSFHYWTISFHHLSWWPLWTRQTQWTHQTNIKGIIRHNFHGPKLSRTSWFFMLITALELS